MTRAVIRLAIGSSLFALTAGCATMDSGETAVAEKVAVETPEPAAEALAENKPQIGEFGFDRAGMDTAVRPGDDFYRYANGTWAASTTIPADKSNYGMFTALDDLSKQRTKGILDEARADPASKIGIAYTSYLDEAAVESKGMAPIKPWLDKVRALNSKAGYAALLAEADRVGIPGMVGGFVGQDDKSPDTYIYSLYQGGIGMPERDYYLADTERFIKIRAAYLSHLTNVLTLAGEGNAAIRAKGVMDFETGIARAHWDKVAASDSVKTYNKMTLAQLARTAPGFDFSTFVRGVGADVTDVIVAHPSAFTGIAKAVQAAPLGVLKDALLIRSIDAYANVLPSAVEKESFAFYGTALSGTPEMEVRWKRAVNFTSGALGEEIGKVYVEKYFPVETKAAMDTLVTNVLGAMGRRIDGLVWMQPATKTRASAKLANFTTKIGYPDRWRDYSALEMRSGDLFGNAWRTAEFGHNYNVTKLGQPIYRWEWGMLPMTINAYANFGMNEIVFPAAILQPPFFDPHADPAINYGGIGAVIGHEISHHFDDQGSKYDENGRLADWWTKADVAAFEAAGKQLIAQYDAYEVLPGEKINGEFTLGENIGDLAGLAVAYDAYRTSLNGQEAPVIDGLTGDQRFYLGWAQVWRRNYREANLSQRLTTDSHSPSIQRVWVVRNLDPWYGAYKPASDSNLYLSPEARVRIW